MKILVTGASGFIGSHLIKRLEEKRYDIVCVSRKKRCPARTILADITKKSQMRKLPKDVDCIFHLAAYVPKREAKAESFRSDQANSLATLNLLEYAKSSKIKKFIYSSTKSVYGAPLYLPVDERHPVNPDNFYAASKYGGELLCRAFAFNYNLNIVILRLAYVYGWGMRKSTVLHKFVTNALRGENLVLVNGGKDILDLVYIDDVVNALLLATKVRSGVYNIGGGKPVSVQKLAKTILKITGGKGELQTKGKVREKQGLYLSIEKTQKELDYFPQVSLEKGLRKYIKVLKRK